MIDLKSMSVGGLIFKTILALMLLAFSVPFYLAAAELKVDKIVFKGNKSFGDSRLKNVLKLKEGEEFDSKFLRLDKTILTNFYQKEGFLNAWLETEIERDADKITVIFNIAEGKQFKLGGIKITGAKLAPPERLRKFFDIQNGDKFQIQAIEMGLNQLERFYFNRGKPYVNLEEEQIEEDSLIFLNINIQENETVYIRDIEYSGLRLVKSFIIHRELEIQKGDMYNIHKIEKSQRNIYSTGLFNYVGMEIQSINGSQSDVRLIIKVVEKKSRWIGVRFGVAYEQEALYGGTFDFTFEFGHRNLFGTARTISFNVIPSLSYDFEQQNIINPKNQYSIRYVEPWIGYTRTPGILSVSFLQIRPLFSADYNFFTSSFQVRHEFSNKWQVSGTISFNRVDVLESDTLGTTFFATTQGQDFIYSIRTNIIRDSRDSYLNPQDGSTLEPTIKFAHANSRKEETQRTVVNRFFKFSFSWKRYQKFSNFDNWVLASRIKVGSILELGKLSEIPLLERYFLGGASTVRGYPEQLLGPVVFNEEGKNPRALGGKLMLLSNIELRIPLFWLFWGEVFTDAGNVWLQNRYFKVSDIKSTSGIGLALVTPIGPVRFDYGIKHRPEKNESPGEFHISISFAF